MNQFYVIENLLDRGKFFTSTSSYDRPQWVGINESTHYITAEMGEKAISKLIKYGVHMVRLQPISEDIPPATDMSTTSTATMGDMKQRDSKEMIAHKSQQVCPICGHNPCTCPVSDVDDDTVNADDVTGVMDNKQENEEITNRSTTLSRGHTVSYKGSEYVVVGDLGNGILQLASADDQTNLIKAPAAELMPVHESVEQQPAINTVDTTKPTIVSEPETKIKVPAEVKTELKAVVDKFAHEAAEYNGRDDARASLAMTVSDAAKELLELISAGTVDSLKQAQIRYGTMMNPITSNLPPSVVKFIASGGTPKTLKEFFTEKKKIFKK